MRTDNQKLVKKYAAPELNLRQSKIYALKVCIIVGMRTTTDKMQKCSAGWKFNQRLESENFSNKNPETFHLVEGDDIDWICSQFDKLPRRRVGLLQSSLGVRCVTVFDVDDIE